MTVCLSFKTVCLDDLFRLLLFGHLLFIVCGARGKCGYKVIAWCLFK